MEAVTRYRTTDLDLDSAEDPTALAAALQIRGLLPVRPVTKYPGGEWFCGFSPGGGDYDEPEPHLADILAVIEGLDGPARSAWAGCSRRLFDIGYDCGREPFAFRQELSAETLVRLRRSARRCASHSTLTQRRIRPNLAQQPTAGRDS